MTRSVWVVLAGVLLVAGCGRVAPETGGGDAGPSGRPRLPSSLATPPGELPALPVSGPVGRGALLYADFAGKAILVLEDGKQFRLPAPPRGEGRQGSTLASLSPDGRWLGYRRSERSFDRRYVIQDLAGLRPEVEVNGHVVHWSADGRFVAIDDSQDGSRFDFLMLQTATGKTQRLRIEPADGSFDLLGLRSDGHPILQGRQDSPSLRLKGPGTQSTLTFASGPDDECWCPSGPPLLGADGATVAVHLTFRNGRVPGTSDKSAPRQANAVVIAGIADGKVVKRWELPGEARWTLLAYATDGLLLQRTSGDNATMLMLLDNETGDLKTLVQPPVHTTIAFPGQALAPGGV